MQLLSYFRDSTAHVPPLLRKTRSEVPFHGARGPGATRAQAPDSEQGVGCTGGPHVGALPYPPISDLVPKLASMPASTFMCPFVP